MTHVVHNARVTITRPNGSTSQHEKVRFVSVPGEPVRVFDSDGTVLAEMHHDRSNEVSDKLHTYHAPNDVEAWSVLDLAGGCGCGK